MKFKTYLESIKKLPDSKIDKFISDKWGSAKTYKYNQEASMELAKILPDILISQDMKFMHIADTLQGNANSAVTKIEQKYNLKEVK